MLAAFGVGQVVWSLLWFFLFFLWIMLLFNVFGDLFRDKALSGIAKVLWIVLLIATPYLGVFIYLIVRGGGMHERQLALVQQQDAAVRDYIQRAASSGPDTGDQLAKIAELKQQGLIDEAEYAAAKAKILS